ncbi:inosine-5-monophosphate dehydrogenase [Pyrococcus furiosus DSM 3638]|uniref:Related to inosine monophosphate dehydrogenase n=3 Tax=Pyrococcus furiosus TaxID=2261 RepID=Q8U3Y0_PYRFU|nr:CBS domain-containing protein [Pyrococcus furiosus]AAL80445.1 related to inosine monophosphate dehydrogenase [Pyrococcus furiosus DSM 3638]AFN03110.1 inosine monophosphate dehydrogenase-like protein [Pyrococcus furiosus COM1]QEK78037.1 inosine-5-monophosphate dehydrogenase [Pyrococcus furiosus DSM 3638]
MVGIQVQEVITDKYAKIDINAPLSEAIGIFEKEDPDLILVFDGNVYKGVLTQDLIIKSHLKWDPTKAKVRDVYKPAPVVKPTDDLSHAAKLMLETDLRSLPVGENKAEIIGVISDLALLERVVAEEFGKRKVEEFMTKDVITLTPDDTVAKALATMRDHGISRIPVVDEEGKLEGLVTLHDLIIRFIKPRFRAQAGELAGEKIPPFSMKLREAMIRGVITILPDATIREAVATMKDNNIDGLVVVDENNKVVGILTVKDLLLPISRMVEKEAKFYLQLGGDAAALSDFTRERIINDIKKFVDGYSDLLGNEGIIYLYIRRFNEKFRGVHLYQARMRVVTDRGVYVATGETWGAIQAVHDALRAIERQLLQKAELERDIRYAKRFIEKLELWR